MDLEAILKHQLQKTKHQIQMAEFTGGSEAGKSRSAERRVRDGLGSFSDHSRLMLGIVRPLGLEFSLVS